MSITGYYDGIAVRVDATLRKNQKVIVIPIENDMIFEGSAEGGLHKYANPAVVEQEKDAWREAAVKKHGQ